LPKQKALLIVNPNANLGRAWRAATDLRPIVEEFGGADWTGTVYPTHAVELARQAALDGYNLVIAAGGDGTVHEVINGLMQVPIEQRPKLGIAPLGSGNDFAFAVGVDKNPAHALRQAFTGTAKRVDVGRMQDGNGRVEYFDNALGIGFDATVTIHSRKFTYVRGFLIYLIAVLQTVILNHDAPRMRISTDQENWEDEVLMMVVCNGPREGGGFLVAPEAKLSDGIFNYALIKRVSRPMMLRLIPEVMNGTHGRFRQVRMGKLCKMELESEQPLPIHADGEILAGFGVDICQVSVEIQPGAVEVVS
jgi:YegS/Rv2252/BmrU family lipid kinase